MRQIFSTVILLGGLTACVQDGASGPGVGPGTPAPLVVQACAGCHGQNGTGSGAVPAIAGRSRPDLVETLTAFRANQRPGTIMGRIARGYTDDEIGAMADHFSSRR